MLFFSIVFKIMIVNLLNVRMKIRMYLYNYIRELIYLFFAYFYVVYLFYVRRLN